MNLEKLKQRFDRYRAAERAKCGNGGRFVIDLPAQHTDAVNLHARTYDWLAKALAAVRPHAAKIIEWGCGIGDGSQAVRHYFPDIEYVGVDSNKDAILYARAQYGDQRTHFWLGEIESILTNGYRQAVGVADLKGGVHGPYDVGLIVDTLQFLESAPKLALERLAVFAPVVAWAVPYMGANGRHTKLRLDSVRPERGRILYSCLDSQGNEVREWVKTQTLVGLYGPVSLSRPETMSGGLTAA